MIEIGKKVKRTDKKYASVGILMEVHGDHAEVEYRERYGTHRIMKTEPLDKLIQVCKERVFRDYARHECGRKVKEGSDLCGLHLGHVKRREREDEARRERQRLAQGYRDQTELLTQHIDKEIDSRGLRVTAPSLAVLHARNGTVSIKLDELLLLLNAS